MKRIFSFRLNFLIIPLSLLLLGFSVTRALNASFTHDESFTFLHFANRSLTHIFSFAHPSANNHILNTLAVKVFSGIFGSGELALRLPNILAQAGYIWFSLLLIRRLEVRLILPAFILLNVNLYLMDFFALSRGYGLAVFLVLGSLYFFLEFQDNGKRRYFSFSLLFAGLAVLSNFTCLYFFLAVLLVYNLFPLARRYANRSKSGFKPIEWLTYNRAGLIAAAMLGAVVWTPITRLVTHKKLYYGGVDGFWADTVQSLIRGTLYDPSLFAKLHRPIEGFIIVVIALSIGLGFRTIFKRNADLLEREKYLIICVTLVVLISCFTTFNHYALGTKFLIGRTALMLLPLFALVVIYVAASLYDILKWKAPIVVIIYLMATTILFHAVDNSNTVYFLDWQYDSPTKRMLVDLEDQIAKDGVVGKPVQLAISWFFDPTVNYYRQRRGLDWLKLVHAKKSSAEDDYYYFMGGDLDRITDYQDRIIRRYENGNLLIK